MDQQSSWGHGKYPALSGSSSNCRYALTFICVCAKKKGWKKKPYSLRLPYSGGGYDLPHHVSLTPCRPGNWGFRVKRAHKSQYFYLVVRRYTQRQKVGGTNDKRRWYKFSGWFIVRFNGAQCRFNYWTAGDAGPRPLGQTNHFKTAIKIKEKNYYSMSLKFICMKYCEQMWQLMSKQAILIKAFMVICWYKRHRI